MNSDYSNPSAVASGDIFATTHWTIVLTAGQLNTPQSAIAWQELYKSYWFPLYAYVRRRGYSREDAEDLTQDFFSKFLEKNYLERVSAERGRFRAFLLASIKHFLANEWDKSQRKKRGGGAIHLSLDWQTADTQFQLGSEHATPEREFDREWALALLAKVIERLQFEFNQEGRSAQFEAFKSFLTVGNSPASYSTTAQLLRMEETAVRVAVHRLRRRYRQLLTDEIAQTLSDPQQVDEEMRALFAAFAS